MATLNKFLRENKVSKMTKVQRNAWYNTLTKPQKAVAICEDVLLQIKNEKYTMKSGKYVSLQIADNITTRTVKDIFKKTALDEVIAAKSITCQVCAMGSCLMSAVRLGNQVEVCDVIEFDESDLKENYWGEVLIGAGDLVSQSENIEWTKLEEAFTVKEYKAMEFVFEDSDIHDTFEDDEESEEVISALSKSEYKKLSSTEKMIKMCKQIIKAGGYFFIEGADLENTNK